MNGNFLSGLVSGVGTGITLGNQFRKMGVESELANVQGMGTTSVAPGDDQAAAVQQSYDKAIAGAATPEDKAKIEEAYKPTFDAVAKLKGTPASVAYSLGTGEAFRQQEKPFTADEVAGQQSTDRQAIYQRNSMPGLAREEQAAEINRRKLAADDRIRAASAGGDGTMDTYISKVAPKLIGEYLQQGDVQSASALTNFIKTDAGQKYASAWSGAMRKVATGDYDGAIPDLQKLHNSVPDGQHTNIKSLGSGNYQIDMIDSATGKTVDSRSMSAADLAHGAVFALTPEKMAEHYANAEERRTREGAQLDRQIELERLRQEGQDTRDDRRDARLGKSLDARFSNDGLTVPQQRTNDSITAARQQLSGLNQADVLKKTQATTATGRENPDYDPQLARTTKLANTRLYGDDPAHDAYTQSMARRNASRDDVATRFRADAGMKNRRLGNQTPQGVQVLDASGKLVGYYQ